MEGTPCLPDGSTFSGNPDADEDGDGVSAQAEYALGGSDSVFDATAGLSIAANAGAAARFSYFRAAAADDMLVIPEVGTDLITWHSDAAWLSPDTQENLPDGRVLSHFIPGPSLAAAGGRAFFRVRIVSGP